MKPYLLFLLLFSLHTARGMQTQPEDASAGLQSADPFDTPEKAAPKARGSHILMPVRDGQILYETITPMDSSAGKEALYRSALNWYMRTFPYAYKNLIVDDQYHGKILGRCSFQFPYSWLMEEYTMKVDFAVDITVRYGKCRLRITDIQPRDEIKPDENRGYHAASTWENRSLEVMNSQYLHNPSPPGFEREKIGAIHTYFTDLLSSFRKNQHELTRFIRGKDAF